MSRPRLRDLGVQPGQLPPGTHNAITDVPGVRVGHVTLWRGEGALRPGEGPVRTGVTAILPGDDPWARRLAAGVEVFNGFGKAVGLTQVAELGRLETPVLLTNTLSVFAAAEGLVRWVLARHPEVGVRAPTVNPVVLECNDGWLNDIRGLHVRPEHALEALAAARPGPVDEGAVGAGTGMVCFGLKGGIGTASRRWAWRGDEDEGEYTLGVLVLANFGRLEELTVDGVPVGRWLAARRAGAAAATPPPADPPPTGSVVVVIATDAPLTSRQLRRVARRAVVGLARTGAMLHHGSGDFALAFSVAGRYPRFRGDEGAYLEPAFRACAEATEEAVLNALCRAETVEGRDGHRAEALPLEELLACLRAHGRRV